MSKNKTKRYKHKKQKTRNKRVKTRTKTHKKRDKTRSKTKTKTNKLNVRQDVLLLPNRTPQNIDELSQDIDDETTNKSLKAYKIIFNTKVLIQLITSNFYSKLY